MSPLLLCGCGHQPAEHLERGEGRCTGRCWDDHYETEYRCLCAAFDTKEIA
jgi:hypothetical protein